MIAGALISFLCVPSVWAVGGCVGYQLVPANAPNLRTIVGGQPEGTTFCFAAGTYRQVSAISPKSNDKFIGAGVGVTILNGARSLTSWSLVGGLYVHAGDVTSYPLSGSCYSGTTCRYHDWLYRNGVTMVRVLSPCSTTNVTTGKFCVDYSAGKIYMKDAPATMEYSRTGGALIMNAAISGVTVQDLTVQMYTNVSLPTILLGNSSTATNLEVKLVHEAGITLTGVGAKVQNSHLHHNGDQGVTAWGSTDAQLTNNEIDNNNTVGFNGISGAGGSKVDSSVHTQVVGNNYHDNNGQSIWFDGDTRGATITGNTVMNSKGIYNGGSAILVEESCDAVISNNTVSGSRSYAIGLRTTEDTLIENNTILASPAPTYGGIDINSDSRIVYPSHPRCTAPGDDLLTTNNIVRNNTITHAAGNTGKTVGTRLSGGTLSGNSFSGNHYHSPDATFCTTRLSFKWWTGSSNVATTWAPWTKTYLQDITGTCGP